MIIENLFYNFGVEVGFVVINGDGFMFDNFGFVNGNGMYIFCLFIGKDGYDKFYVGEIDFGMKYCFVIWEGYGWDNDGSFYVCINVEIDQYDKEGKMQVYGLMVLLLCYNKVVLNEYVFIVMVESVVVYQEVLYLKQ